MATHGTLRTDLFDVSSIYEEEVTVLVPGPGFPENPRDYRTETLRYPNAEAVRELFRKLDGLQKVHTLSPAATDDDVIYQAVIHKDDVIYAANPDDPANPDEISLSASITVQEEGSDLTQRAKLNFIGPTVTAADDAGNSRTNVTITGYDTIRENGGTAVTQRRTLNFKGDAVTVTDDSGSARTDVEIIPQALQIAMLTGNVPAATMNGSSITATPGISSTAVATLMDWDGDGLVALQEDLGAGDVDAVRKAFNFTMTEMRAGTTDPLLVVGYEANDSTSGAFVVVGPFDHRILPGFDGSSTVPQVPHQDGAGADDFVLDSEEC